MWKYISSILLTALLGLLAGIYLPWWGIAVAAFIASIVIPQSPLMSFLSGFLGVFLLWEILAWWIDNKNNNILAQKMAMVLPLGGSTMLLILVGSLIGGLVAGSAALAGSYVGIFRGRSTEISEN